MKKKALVIGINKYPKSGLNGCVNDAEEINSLLKNNEDMTVNFDTKLILDEEATKDNLLNNIKELFENETDISLLYFSGHGSDDEDDGCIRSVELGKISFKEIIDIADKSKSHYKVIILDCCFSGKLGNLKQIGDKTVLSDNTVILTACSPIESAIDNLQLKHGVFTNLLIESLQGGASDILGNITPGSVYAHIDQSLNTWEQRPYFKANVSSFVSLRNVKPKIEVNILKEGLNLFKSDAYEYQLDPSYEYTNVKKFFLNKAIKPYAKEENVKKMKILQRMNQNGLVVPVNDEFMYYAAMNTNKAKLTNLGKHYWNLYKKNKF